ncbi:hypothetical protein IIC38_19890 [candidate division KSB1 bacterium]|nr:hypothetical protein [candidate division KSB1 bacterium]
MLDTGCWMLDAGCWMLDARCWMLDTGCYSYELSSPNVLIGDLFARSWRLET